LFSTFVSENNKTANDGVLRGHLINLSRKHCTDNLLLRSLKIQEFYKKMYKS